MRVLLWIIGVPLLLIVLAVLLVPMLLDAKALADIAAKQIREQTGAELRVDGDVAISLFPRVALSANEIFVNIPESKTQIEARSLAAGVSLFPLFKGSVEIDSILVDGVTVTAEAVDEEVAKTVALDTSTLSNAELDAFYAAREDARAQAQADLAASVLAAPLALEVAKFSLEDIRIITVDSAGDAISELQLREFSADGLNTDGRPVPLRAHVLIPGDTGVEPVEIVINGNITTDLGGNSIVLNGMEVRVTGATPDPVELTMNGDFAIDTKVATMALDLAIGELKGSGKLRYASLESPQLDAQLALTELNPALLILAGPDAAAEMPDPDASSEGTAPLPLHALRMIDTRAQLTIDTVLVDVHRLEDVTATLRVVDGIVTLDPVSATVHDGKIDFSAVLNGRYNLAKLSTKGGVNSLNVGAAVAAMDAGVEASGVASLDWNLSGSGRDADELTGSLTGPISFTTDDITLRGIAMEQMLCRGVALVNQETLSGEFPDDTRFNALSADIQLANGVATLDPLTAQLNAVSLSGNGTLDLDSQDLRASFRAQLSEALGELDPACRINERYTDLRWPVECKGNLAGDPATWCGMNTTEIIRDLAEGEAKRKVQDEAGKLLKKLFE
jgi:uncharacterized protein involved in outer membrane biogenesis